MTLRSETGFRTGFSRIFCSLEINRKLGLVWMSRQAAWLQYLILNFNTGSTYLTKSLFKSNLPERFFYGNGP